MTKRAILLSTLLLAACVAFAQNSSGYGSQDSSQTTTSPTTSAQSSGGKETFRGCLSKEGPEFYLTTLGANHERFELTGDTTKLAAHVGHEISVTGSVQNTGSTATGTMGGGNTSSTGTLVMEKFHHISATCPE
jgi:hypothetical protein